MWSDRIIIWSLVFGLAFFQPPFASVRQAQALTAIERAVIQYKPPVAIGGGSPGTWSVDGTPQAASNSGSTITLPAYTTSLTNSRFMVAILLQGNSAAVSAVSGGTLGAFTQRAHVTDGSGDDIWVFYKDSSSAKTSEVVTVTLTGTIFFSAAHIFAAHNTNGAITTFDANGNQFGTGSTAPTMTPAVSGSFTYAIIANANNLGTNGAGWTQIVGASPGQFITSEWQTGATSLLTGTIAGDTQQNIGFIDAIDHP